MLALVVVADTSNPEPEVADGKYPDVVLADPPDLEL